MRILLIGCGSIGTVLAGTAQEAPEVESIFISDAEKSCAENLLKSCSKARFVSTDKISSVLDETDLMIEAASQAAASTYVPIALEKGVDVMVMSVGSFADESYRRRCMQSAREHHCRIYVPSGAVCGTDGIHAASAGDIEEVHLTTTKGPKSLRNVPALKEAGIDVDSLKSATVVFDGCAEEAVAKFPKNINVAATVSLLGIGFSRTRVTIVCDPSAERNSHVITAKGSFGELRCEVNNLPSPNNPATSYLAALSASAALKRIIENVWIGI